MRILQRLNTEDNAIAIERLSYMGLRECVKITNGIVDIIATTEVGPRILFYGPAGGANIFGEHPESTYNSELGVWKPYGGHRLWVWPELFPATYAPDSDPVECLVHGDYSIVLRQPVDGAGIQKEIAISLSPDGSSVSIKHSITSRNLWPIQVALWPITVVAQGTAIVPRLPYQSHDESVEVGQPLVLWAFTDLQDPRFMIDSRYVLLSSDASLAHPQKFGLHNSQRWCAHLVGQTLFVKRFDYDEHAKYPDFGSNTEVYVEGSFMELELLGPVQIVKPDATACVSETWSLYQDIGIRFPLESSNLHQVISPLIKE